MTKPSLPFETAIAAALILAVLAIQVQAAPPDEAARGLIERLAPAKAGQFVLETIPSDGGRDVFELESRDGKIVVRGSTGVAIASGWNWYLKYYCHCQVSLCGDNLALPDPLPAVPEKIRRVSPLQYRYYLNFCAFSYSLPWLDWPQWERLIDWMALHGINAPLSVTGQEAVWRNVYRGLGLTDKQLEGFFVGPGYLPFGWMGCIDAWGGPLPQTWIDKHLDLQKKIAARELALGMTPVMQGFTGHVPSALKEKFPAAKLQQLPSWCGFPPTHFLDPQDPLFVRIGKTFIEEQTRQFGTAHLYASDTFIEMPPPSSDPKFLASMGKSVYEAMRAADPEAVWFMQGWLFINAPQFWKPPQAKALFGAVPDDRMVLLDLACEDRPVWDKTEAFYGKPWIFGLVQDFGGVVSMHAGLPQIAGNLRTALTSPTRGRLCGIGFVNEALGYNPVVNEFFSEMTWRAEVPKLEGFVNDFVAARYGNPPAAAAEAWKLLQETVYRSASRTGSTICVRPNFSGGGDWCDVGQPYDNAKLAEAWHKLLACSGQLGGVDAYRFDLVQLGRQVLGNHASALHRDMIAAFKKKDRKALAEASERFFGLIRDVDELLATREELLLGKWLADAKHWAANDNERKLYEWNARNLITLWGPRDSGLHEYANRMWSGMLTGFYLPRWEMFVKRLDESLADGKPLDAAALDLEIRQWEVQWTHRSELYPAAPHGDAAAVSGRLWEKYGKQFTGK